jgi:hypothetical protein
MKKYLLLFSVALLSFTNIQNPIDRIGVAGPLKFGNIAFNLSWSEKANDNYYIQEYLPNGENAANFNQMLTIHLFTVEITAEQAVEQKIKELDIRKKNDPACEYHMTKSSDGKEYLLDFVLSEKGNSDAAIVEFNIYRFKQINLDDNRNGIFVYAYSKRAYGNKSMHFTTDLQAKRLDLLKQVSAAKIPIIKLSGVRSK